jgi:competence protein ComEC
MRLLLLVVGVLGFLVLVRLLFFFLLQPPVSTHYSGTVTLFDEPKRYSYYQSFWVDDIEIQAPKYPQFHYGDTISITGTIELKEYTQENGKVVVKHVVKDPDIHQELSPIIIRASSHIRSRIIETLSQTTDADAAALLLGITLGVQEGFSSELYDRFRLVRILHVVAASGSNVALLAGVLMGIFSLVLHRKHAIIGTGLLLAWYAVLSGLDPAILRATCMALVVFSAQLLGRQSSALFSLYIVSCGLLLASPTLIQDIGFQLSVMATLGIILGKSLLDRIGLFKLFRFFRDDITTTLAATWGSLPILIWQFGTFAPLGILVNVFVLWTVPVLMIIGMIASVMSLVFPPVAAVCMYLAYPLLIYFLFVAEQAESVVSAIEFPIFSWMITISYGLISASILLYLRRKDAT